MSDLRTYDESYPPSLWETPEEPAPEPDPEPATPTTSWVKAAIVEWLLGHGVTLDEAALTALTKAELLDLVADLLDPDAEPDPEP